MGYVPPPNAISLSEFKRRWNSGKRTLAEIDPEFEKWNRQQDVIVMIDLIFVAVSFVMAGIIFPIILFWAN